MKEERARLVRLQRLERVRAIAKQSAVAEAAQAESTLAQLEALLARTRALADQYGANGRALDGGDLRQLGSFAHGLRAISANTANDTARARQAADVKHAALNEAERRRAAVEERVEHQARVIAKGSENLALGARRKIGTGLE